MKLENENTKPANAYNGRKPTSRKPGTQKGHKGAGLSKADIEEKIYRAVSEYYVEEIRTPGRPYITRYHLDLDVKTVATEIRIYMHDAMKYRILPEIKGDVKYDRGIKSIAVFLYSEGMLPITGYLVSEFPFRRQSGYIRREYLSFL